MLPVHRRESLARPGWATDCFHIFLSAIPIRLGLTIVIMGATGAGAWLTPGSLQDGVRALPLWLGVVLAIVVADFGFYIAHRLMHASPRLWRFHAVHHSSERLDWLASYRVHPVDQVIVKGASLFLVFSLGFSEAADWDRGRHLPLAGSVASFQRSYPAGAGEMAHRKPRISPLASCQFARGA